MHGRFKQGAAYGYTKVLGYHPLLASRADTGEVLHVRCRKGAANTQRGVLRFAQELVARVRKAGGEGELLLRADPGFLAGDGNQRLENVLGCGVDEAFATLSGRVVFRTEAGPGLLRGRFRGFNRSS